MQNRCEDPTAELRAALVFRRKTGGAPAQRTRLLARGPGWTVEDVICTAGPRDATFGEKHHRQMIAVVVAGSFDCRTDLARELMTPGSLMLGNVGQCFECGHRHGVGDRCIAFGYTPEYFEQMGASRFRSMRLPPITDTAPLVSAALRGLVAGAGQEAWLALSARFMRTVVPLAANTRRGAPPPAAIARVSRSVRHIDADPSAAWTLEQLAAGAGLSVFHFLRTFDGVTGLTPHQYIRRARLRNAALQLSTNKAKVVDIALDSGFGDITGFNRAFRAEFGVTPLIYRKQAR